MNASDDDRSPATSVAEASAESDESVVLAVIRAVADASGTATTALPPLSDVIDPDALGMVVGSLRSNGRVAFPYHGFTVVVRATGTVEVYDDA